LREQISRAEQAEVTVRMHQVRVKLLPMKASGGSKTSACRNGPTSEHLFRPLEKHKSCLEHPL
jgi:hypothetical protein